MPDLTVSELGRRYGVAHTTVQRALARAAELRAAGDTGLPEPPAPVTVDGETRRIYPSDAMDTWWPLWLARRPPPGRPPHPAPKPGNGPREEPLP